MIRRLTRTLHQWIRATPSPDRSARRRSRVSHRSRRASSFTRLLGVAVVFAAVPLGGCGSASGDRRGGTHAVGTPRTAAAHDARRSALVMTQAFAANPKADSGHISGTIGVSVKGVPRFAQPVVLTMVGRFNDPGGSALAAWDELLGLDVHGLSYGAGMTSSAGKVYLNIGSTAFELPPSTVALMVATAGGARNGLMKVLGGFGLRPESWVRAPRIAGDEQLDGVAVVHLTFAIDPPRVFGDAGHFTQLLTALRVTGLVDLPQAISPSAQAALVRSVSSAHGDAYIGASDHVVHRARMTMTLAVRRADRPALAGISSASISIGLDVTEAGAPQQINVQHDRQPWANAIPLLNAVAFGNRPAGQRGN